MSTDNDVYEKLGLIQGRLGALEKEVGEIKDKLGPMYDVLMKAQGGWKVMVFAGGVCASIGALILKGVQAIWPHS